MLFFLLYIKSNKFFSLTRIEHLSKDYVCGSEQAMQLKSLKFTLNNIFRFPMMLTFHLCNNTLLDG